MCEITSLADVRDAIRALTPEDQAQLMLDMGPELCLSVMQRPEMMQQMGSRCEEMMRDPELQKVMRPMMERMFSSMMGGNR